MEQHEDKYLIEKTRTALFKLDEIVAIPIVNALKKAWRFSGRFWFPFNFLARAYLVALWITGIWLSVAVLLFQAFIIIFVLFVTAPAWFFGGFIDIGKAMKADLDQRIAKMKESEKLRKIE